MVPSAAIAARRGEMVVVKGRRDGALDFIAGVGVLHLYRNNNH